MSRSLLILDRDGVINLDSDDYIKTLDEWIPIPSSIEAIARLSQAGWTVAVATNQSGIARGYFSEDDFMNLTEWMDWSLADRDVDLDGIYFCPHHPDHGAPCDCRNWAVNSA